MEKTESELKMLANRLMGEKWEAKKETKKYVKSVLQYMDQTDMMKEIDKLTYKELRMIQGCGIPGDAWRHANTRLREMKQKADAVISEDGKVATMSYDPEQKPEGSTSGKGGVQTSKTG